MDACLRCLRDGSLDKFANVGLILSASMTHGSSAIFEQVLRDIVAAAATARSQAQQVHAVAVDVAPSKLKAAGVRTVTDCFTDPCGWLDASKSHTEQVQWNDLNSLKQLAHASPMEWACLVGNSSQRSTCVVIAGLDTLLLRHPTMQVVQALIALRSHPCVSSILMSLHQDLHSVQVLSAVQSLVNTVLQLHLVQGLQLQLITQATGKPCHGQMTASSKRSKVGRLKVEQQAYRLVPDGRVDVFALPEGLGADARALVETALASSQLVTMECAAAATPTAENSSILGLQHQAPDPGATATGTAAGEDLAKKLGSSMRLEVSEQERAAKASVQLPYVHQGTGKSYEGGDYRQYLPPAAGGYGPGVEDAAGSGKLGHILYVRDSEEEHDSDEDPDDDLDI